MVARERARHPGATVAYRDLAAVPAMHLSPAHMAVFTGQAQPDTALGADMGLGASWLEELVAADVVVIGAPMYNFSLPTQLKAWIDRVCVADVTFKATPQGYVSLLPGGKRAVIASARGGLYGTGMPAAALEHHESYLTGVLGFLGIADVEVVRAEGLALGPEARDAAIAAAHARIAA